MAENKTQIKVNQIKDYVGEFVILKQHGSGETRRLFVKSNINGVIRCECKLANGRTVYYTINPDAELSESDYDIFVEQQKTTNNES